MTQAQLTIRLFFNKANGAFYVQIGDDALFPVKDRIIIILQEKYGLHVIHADDTKQMQQICKTQQNDKSNSDRSDPQVS